MFNERLKEAVLKGNFEDAKAFLRDINEQDANGITAVMHAVIDQNPDAVLFLLENGARVDLVDFDGLNLLAHARRAFTVAHPILGNIQERLFLIRSLDEVLEAPPSTNLPEINTFNNEDLLEIDATDVTYFDTYTDNLPDTNAVAINQNYFEGILEAPSPTPEQTLPPTPPLDQDGFISRATTPTRQNQQILQIALL